MKQFKDLDLARVDDYLALLLVRASDEKHVVDRGGVVQDRLELVRGQHVPGLGLQEVDSALVDGQPQVLWPVRGERLLKQREEELLASAEEKATSHRSCQVLVTEKCQTLL